MVEQWRLNDVKPILPQAQFFGMIPLDATRWAHSRFSQIFPMQNILMAGHQGTTSTVPQQQPTIHPQIHPPQINTAVIPVYQIDASAVRALL